jgi:ComF family protein
MPSRYGYTHEKCLKTNSVPKNLTCVYIYEDKVRECIRKSKYMGKEFMALKRLSFDAVNIAYEWGLDYDGYTIVPVPISKSRRKQRGFNQVDIIARSFSLRFKLKVDNSILIRVKNTKTQHGLSRVDRFRNVSGSFKVEKDISGAKILLLDDICTTGATFLTASKTLYAAGASEVRCFALSKKLRDLV